MIDAVTVTDYRVACARVVGPWTMSSVVSSARIRALVRAHARLRRSLAEQGDDDVVRELATHLILGSASVFRGSIHAQLGLSVAGRWLERNGYLMLPTPDDAEWIAGIVAATTGRPAVEAVDAVRAWVGRNVLDVTSGRPLSTAATMTRSPQCFVACPLTGVSGDARAQIVQLSKLVATLLSEYGILTVQPAMYADPNLAAHSVVRSVDESLIAESDLVLILALRPSLGLGVVSALAQRYGRPTLLVTGGSAVSPLVAGLDPEPTVLPLDRVATDLRRYLDLSMVDIVAAARRRRQALAGITSELERIRAGIEARSSEEIVAQSASGMSRQRFRELINSPDMFAGATYAEIRELHALAAL